MDVDYEFTVADLSIKCKSKAELYNLLSREGNIFLPPSKDWTQQFMRDLMHWDKRHIKLNKVKLFKFRNTKDYMSMIYWSLLRPR